ncbi:hypothetical protein TGVEG_213748 [Toxoplasma gondii VEG]|uniref:Uncharacterized protein n=1 Tax=Toxoplasma gondii (strain ATCC 50861 / VEG) TaxID=432359 RepID=V4ZEJ6_TOXGV|nr:hypothetical protein TGVEG_213748 [Toxoplasma gondii VEG]
MALPETPSRATLFLKVHPVANAATNDGRSICVVASVSSEMKSRIRIDLSLPQLLSLYRQIRRNGEARLEMALTASHCFCVPFAFSHSSLSPCLCAGHRSVQSTFAGARNLSFIERGEAFGRLRRKNSRLFMAHSSFSRFSRRSSRKSRGNRSRAPGGQRSHPRKSSTRGRENSKDKCILRRLPVVEERLFLFVRTFRFLQHF